jgi:orotate phosphoribosyltransferase
MASASKYLQTFIDAGALLEGHFLLTSGLHSPRYLQCALVLQDPALAGRLCKDLAGKLKDLKVETVIGPALGGIVVAYELARALGVRGIFAERQDGQMTLRRGFQIRPGERLLLAEDVVTTGGSLKEVMAIVREAGGTVVGVASLVNRCGARDPAFGVPFVSLLEIGVPTYEAAACPLCKQGQPVVKPGSRGNK